jgi:hypothetical protein
VPLLVQNAFHGDTEETAFGLVDASKAPTHGSHPMGPLPLGPLVDASKAHTHGSHPMGPHPTPHTPWDPTHSCHDPRFTQCPLSHAIQCPVPAGGVGRCALQAPTVMHRASMDLHTQHVKEKAMPAADATEEQQAAAAVKAHEKLLAEVPDCDRTSHHP